MLELSELMDAGSALIRVVTRAYLRAQYSTAINVPESIYDELGRANQRFNEARRLAMVRAFS